jgi:predicted Rossmann fold flavoprotein
VTDTFPALVPLVLDASMFHAGLAGLSHEAELTLSVDGKLRDRRRGSMLWTHFGISGPVVLDISRHWTLAVGSGRLAELRCNFLPERSFDQVEALLIGEATWSPRRQVSTVLEDFLPRRLAVAIATSAGIDPARRISQLGRTARRNLAHALTGTPLPVLRDRGWNYAEVTAGGVPLEEVNFRTMESRKLPGLYLTGELLDCDGRIGGFNFQWAWSTGYLAGRGAAAALMA